MLVVETLRGVDQGQQLQIDNVLLPKLLGLHGASSPSAFATVKAIALNKRELQGQRHSFWAGFWRREISVGFQRDIA